MGGRGGGGGGVKAIKGVCNTPPQQRVLVLKASTGSSANSFAILPTKTITEDKYRFFL